MSLKTVGEYVVVHLMGPVDEIMMLQPKEKSWGFFMSFEDKSVYVVIGDRKRLEDELDKRKDYLPHLVIEACMASDDELAHELLDSAINGCDGMVINGQEFDSSELEDVIDSREDN
jgi:hypothetical protein